MPIPWEIRLPRFIPLPNIGQARGDDGLGPEVPNRVIAVAGLDGESAINVCLTVRFRISLQVKIKVLTAGNPDGANGIIGHDAAVVHLLIGKRLGRTRVVPVDRVSFISPHGDFWSSWASE